MAEEEKKEKSQSTTAAPTLPNPTVQAAQDEAALAKARAEKVKAEKEIIEHQRDKMKAELMPVAASDKVTAPTGDVATDEAGFVEVQILGQEAARKIARMLAADLKEHLSFETLVIYNAADISALTAYGAVLRELKEFTREFELKRRNADGATNAAENVLKSPDFELPAEAATDLTMAVLAAPAIAAGAVKSIAELVNLFRTTTEIKNKALTGSEDLVLSYLVQEFNLTDPPRDVAVYSPALFPRNLVDSSEETEFIITLRAIREGQLGAQKEIKKIDALSARIVSARTETQAALDAKETEIITKKTELVNLALNDPNRPALEAALQELRAEENDLKKRLVKFNEASSSLSDLNAALQFLTTAAEQMLGGLETPDVTTKQSPLANLLVVGHLHKLLNDAGTFTVRFTTAVNGTTKIKKNLFWNASIRHSAGVSLAYQMFNSGGRIVRANAFQWYFDWKSSEEISAMLPQIYRA